MIAPPSAWQKHKIEHKGNPNLTCYYCEMDKLLENAKKPVLQPAPEVNRKERRFLRRQSE